MKKIFDYIKLRKELNTLKVLYEALVKEKEDLEEQIDRLNKDKDYLVSENRELKSKVRFLKSKRIDKQMKNSKCKKK